MLTNVYFKSFNRHILICSIRFIKIKSQIYQFHICSIYHLNYVKRLGADFCWTAQQKTESLNWNVNFPQRQINLLLAEIRFSHNIRNHHDLMLPVGTVGPEWQESEARRLGDLLSFRLLMVPRPGCERSGRFGANCCQAAVNCSPLPRYDCWSKPLRTAWLPVLGGGIYSVRWTGWAILETSGQVGWK